MSSLPNPHHDFRTSCESPVSFVATPKRGTRSFVLPEEIGKRVIVDVIHDGDVIPGEFLVDSEGESIAREAFHDDYVLERDWGASLLAEELTTLLGLSGFWKVEIARVVMDFGRFPGITPKDADHLSRHAINYPFSALLGFAQKRRILEHYYDAISKKYNEFVPPAQVKIALHTYDVYNRSGTRRPPASILTRCVGYQVSSEMPFGVFDPLYPDILGEFTSDRILRDRLSLTMESSGIHTEHNYPYLLPDGSVEVRSQVWSFFHTAKKAFQAAYPETKSDGAFAMVWRMLLDTNLRSSQSEMLRSYLHAFRRVPVGREEEFAVARRAYERIKAFVYRDGKQFVESYRHMPGRPSALGIEVRKDLLFELDGKGHPVAPKTREVRKIARILARALHIYFTEDCPKARTSEFFGIS
ncbi:hypothetical protein [Haliangium ochraceum]|uniref:Uncharacterized protein n=1 Tax=Haliangium ochraceum (strain DSM 14365 / JCM 11303 / SMP-2) TaxID=502025 RepID=D0LIR7_HALO1|nr:hypothetical protein [Haliangium ochraceum]ACY12946.1 hypothetical protein Hoch_0305 [Haliangium ochraceum DSM 14365]